MEEKEPEVSPIFHPQFSSLPDYSAQESLCSSVLPGVFSTVSLTKGWKHVAAHYDPPAQESPAQMPRPQPRAPPLGHPSSREPGPQSSQDPNQEVPGHIQRLWTLQVL